MATKTTKGARKTSSARKFAGSHAERTPPRIGNGGPLEDVSQAYERARGVLQAVLRADVLPAAPQKDLKWFVAVMDVMCGLSDEAPVKGKRGVRT